MLAQKGLIWDRMLDFAGVSAEDSLMLLFGQRAAIFKPLVQGEGVDGQAGQGDMLNLQQGLAGPGAVHKVAEQVVHAQMLVIMGVQALKPGVVRQVGHCPEARLDLFQLTGEAALAVLALAETAEEG